MAWLPYIYALYFALIAWRLPQYRNTGLILLTAFCINIVLYPIYENLANKENFNVVFLYGGIDAITGWAMIMFGSKNRTIQAMILVVAVLLNVISLVDFNTQFIPVSVFSWLIFIMTLAQMLYCGGTDGIRRLAVFRNNIFNSYSRGVSNFHRVGLQKEIKK